MNNGLKTVYSNNLEEDIMRYVSHTYKIKSKFFQE